MSAVDDLLVAATDGVDCDGLVVAHETGGYRFETPDAAHDDLPESALRELAAEHADLVANWHYWEREVGGHDTPRRAFLRWIEAADERPVDQRHETLREGVARTWGQLRVAAHLTDDGSRRYALCHVEDAGGTAPGGTDGAVALDDLSAPRDLREVVKYDDRGRYRPLKSAPTLDTGWRLADLEGDALYDAVEAVYPASVANWHRERTGGLDVTHFRETAERQTGIYDVVDELPVDALADLAGACCVDSQCLKRREWDEDADTPLDVPRGEGAFPCREPCSLFVAAARKVAIRETETPREYTFELTPSEKNQLEAILEAVADGQVGEIREADLGEGANRYMARYLREKRLTERGLSDVPTTGGE